MLTGSASELEARPPVRRLRRRPRRVPARARAAAAGELDEATRAELGAIFPALEGRRGRGRSLPPAPRGRARCWRSSRPAAGADPRRRPLGRHRLARAARRAAAAPAGARRWCSRSPSGRARSPSGWRSRSSARRPDADRARRLSRDEARELVGDDAEHYDASGGNPFYLHQLARAPPAGHGAGRRARGRRGPARGRRGARRRARACSPTAPARRSRAQRSRATRSSPSSPRRRRGVDEPRRSTPSTSSLPPTSSATTDVPRRFRFRHPLVRRAVYESAPAGWRIGAHERAAAALAARGAQRSSAPTTSSAPRGAGTSRRSPSCARPPRRCAAAHPPRPRGCTRPRCALSRGAADPRAAPRPGPGAPRGRRMARRPRRPGRGARARPGNVRMTPCARRSSTCSAATPRPHARLETALRALPSEAGDDAAC